MHKLYFDSDDDELKYQNLHAPRDPTKQTDAPGDQQHLIRKDELIIRDLFIWAVLYNYIDMAKVFLAHIKYRICAALIATDILKKYHSKASHGALKNGYMKNSEYFEQYAMDCIDQCEKNEPDLACEIVLQRIDLFGYITCLQVRSFVFVFRFVSPFQWTSLRWRPMLTIKNLLPRPAVYKRSRMCGMTRVIQRHQKNGVESGPHSVSSHSGFLHPWRSNIEKKRLVANLLIQSHAIYLTFAILLIRRTEKVHQQRGMSRQSSLRY